MTFWERQSRTGQPRRLLCFSAAFCLPCLIFALAYSRGWPLPLCWSVGAAFCVALPLWICKRRHAAAWLLGLGAGALWPAVFWLLALRPVESWAGKGAELTVEVTERAVGYATYGTVEGRLLALNGKPARGRILVYLLDGSPELEPGEQIAFTGAVRSSERRSDGLMWEARQDGSLRRSIGAPISWRARLARWSDALGRRIDTLLDGDAGALFKALLCGDKSDMSRRLRSALNVSGLSHIAAVSGLHLSALAGFCCALLGKRRGFAAAIPILILYAGLTGFSPSVLRAAVMTLLVIAGFFLRRESDPMTALFTALLLLTAANPFSLLSPSLLLSFSATLGILLFAPALPDAFPKPSRQGLLQKPAGYLVQCTAVSIAATVSTLPVSMLFFSRVSLLSVLSSLLVLWAVELALALGIAVLLLSVLWPWAAAVAARWLLRPALGYIEGAARLLGGNPALTAASDSPYLLMVWAAALAFLLVLRKKQKGARRLLPLTGGALALCLLLSGTEGLLLTRVSIVDTGGSAAILVCSRGQTGLLNCGLSAAGRNARRLEEQLYRWGQSGVDELIITADSARAGGGLRDVQKDLEIRRCIAPEESAAARWADSTYAGGGSLQWGAVRVEIIPLCGRSQATRVLLPHAAVLDLTQTAPIDYITCPTAGRLTGDVIVMTAAFLENGRAMELLLQCAGCRAVFCADSSFHPVDEHERSGVGIYSLSQQENIELSTLNW